MTTEPEIEIERCVCGKPGRLMHGGGWFWSCHDGYCWVGPRMETREQALAAGNALMRAAKERVRLQRELYAAHDLIVGEHDRIFAADGTEYAADVPTEAARRAWWANSRAAHDMPLIRCTCPDCTEHRARVSAQEKTT